jgi:hypothetical protein
MELCDPEGIDRLLARRGCEAPIIMEEVQMKDLRILLCIGFMSCSALFSTNANATTAGTVVLNISGTFKTPVTAGGVATCSGIVALVPSITGLPTIASLSAALVFNSSQQSASASAVITKTGTNFSCSVTVPYLWDDAIAGQQMGIVYTVLASDPGFFNGVTFVPGTHPGKTRQVIKIIAIPANGTTTTLTIPASL